MSKPSDVAMGLADRFTLNAIRAAHALKQDFCTDAGCVCGGHQLVRDAALAIDAAIQRAVERERERWQSTLMTAIKTMADQRNASVDLLLQEFAALRATPNTGG